MALRSAVPGGVSYAYAYAYVPLIHRNNTIIPPSKCYLPCPPTNIFLRYEHAAPRRLVFRLLKLQSFGLLRPWLCLCARQQEQEQEQEQDSAKKQKRLRIERDLLRLHVLDNTSKEAVLHAVANLRVRTFYDFKQSYRVEEHRRYMSGLELEALKERIEGKRLGFKRVACVFATLCDFKLSEFPDDLYASCKASIDNEEHVVVGSLDLNQSKQLPDEISGIRPEGFAADFTRAYLTNVCVAHELHRNGIGRALIMQAVKVAHQWGMTDLYVHVAVDNGAARYLYEKSGFVYESDEPAWSARFLGRPRRLLFWASVTNLLSLAESMA